MVNHQFSCRFDHFWLLATFLHLQSLGFTILVKYLGIPAIFGEV